jgi:hypothetical protein
MRTIPCLYRNTDQEFFSSLKRMRSYEDGSSMCITVGFLYTHRSFHRNGRSDGYSRSPFNRPEG